MDFPGRPGRSSGQGWRPPYGPQAQAGSPAWPAPAPKQPSYDEFVGEVTVSIGDDALRRVDGDDAQSVRAILSAATVSGHWLLSEDVLMDIDPVEGPALGRHFRALYRDGTPPERHAIESIIAVSALLLTIFYSDPTERSRTFQGTKRALSLGPDLEKDLSSLLDEAGSGEIESHGPEAFRLANLAAEVIVRHTSSGGGPAPVLSPLKLLIMIDTFGDFFAGLSR